MTRARPLVFLFEEYMPLDDRQQLSADVQNKRTWRPSSHLARQSNVIELPLSTDAPTLSDTSLGVLTLARPSSKGPTEIISLGRDGPLSREIPHPGSGPTGLSQNPHTQPDISSPLFVAPREELHPILLPHSSKPVPQQASKAPETGISDVLDYPQALHAVRTRARLA